VVLADQFGKAKVAVLTATTLCAPVTKNNIEPKDKTTHLVCYQDQGKPAANKKVLVVNQFGAKQVMAVGGATILCVPSLKTVL
jgi:hypothetical protein